jgi:hypothetical protein
VATSALIPGDHTIAATFRGDTRLLPSSGALRQTISCAVISGTRTTAVTVSQATCLQGATLNAGVTINPGGSLLVDHSQVNGPVVSDRAVAVRICASSVSSNVSLTRSSGFVLLGDGADNDVGVAPCGGNTIKGVANLANGSSPVQLGGNFVTGMNLTANTGSPARLERNHVTGTLACAGNAPAPTDNGEPNVAGARLGQCGAPGF